MSDLHTATVLTIYPEPVMSPPLVTGDGQCIPVWSRLCKLRCDCGAVFLEWICFAGDEPGDE